jgi:hypothetical protein
MDIRHNSKLQDNVFRMLKKNKQWRQDCDVWRLTFFLQ